MNYHSELLSIKGHLYDIKITNIYSQAQKIVDAGEIKIK